MNNFFDRILSGNYNPVDAIGGTTKILKKNKKQFFYLCCKNLVVTILFSAILGGMIFNLIKDVPVESIDTSSFDIENIENMTNSEILESIAIFQNADFLINFVIGIVICFISYIIINFISSVIESKILDNIIMNERRNKLEKSLMYYFKKYGLYFLVIVIPNAILIFILNSIINTFDRLIQTSDTYLLLSLLTSFVSGIVQIFLTVVVTIIFFEYLLIGKSFNKAFNSLLSIGIKNFLMIVLFVFLLNMVIGIVFGITFSLLIVGNIFALYIFTTPIFYTSIILTIILSILIITFMSVYIFFGININYLNYRYKLIGRDDFIEECGLNLESYEDVIVEDNLL